MFAQTCTAAPVIFPGTAGLDIIANVLAVLAPQPLFALTDSVPDVNAAKKLTVTKLVPCPLAMVALAGAVQL